MIVVEEIVEVEVIVELVDEEAEDANVDFVPRNFTPLRIACINSS